MPASSQDVVAIALCLLIAALASGGIWSALCHRRWWRIRPLVWETVLAVGFAIISVLLLLGMSKLSFLSLGFQSVVRARAADVLGSSQAFYGVLGGVFAVFAARFVSHSHKKYLQSYLCIALLNEWGRDSLERGRALARAAVTSEFRNADPASNDFMLAASRCGLAILELRDKSPGDYRQVMRVAEFVDRLAVLEAKGDLDFSDVDGLFGAELLEFDRYFGGFVRCSKATLEKAASQAPLAAADSIAPNVESANLVQFRELLNDLWSRRGYSPRWPT